jgi:alpha-glucosidase
MTKQGVMVKIEVKGLSQLVIRKMRAEIYGENGALFITPFSQFFYVEYKIGLSQKPSFNDGYNQNDINDNLKIRGSNFESIQELEDRFILFHNNARLEVIKETAVVSFYWKNKLVFGGNIGNSDTVLPKFPLRIQYDSLTEYQKDKECRWPARFNFKAEPEDVFFGLGEKTGKLNKSYRRFKMFNRDALGYDPEYSDPLYIEVPFYFQINRGKSTIAAVYFPSEAVEEIDFLVESNFYTAVTMGNGPYAYIVFVGDTYKEILANYMGLVGKPALPPKFAFGFFGSSMSYAEPNNAQEKIKEYFQKIEEYKIPCEGMYLSSGYIKAENGRRYTFLWNQAKFPNPKEFFKSFSDRGYRFCCNVKPGFLLDHPWYEELKNKDYFIKNTYNEAAVEYYWGNYASLIDFSNVAAYDWWKEQIKKTFLNLGILGIWNDNNEFELEDDAIKITKKLPVLMSKASYEASQEVSPGKRPWIVSRSGFTGIQRYASTWTGDNVSNEKTMFMNIPMGFNLGLSGIFFYGHDIGGFYGPRPGKELLLRWCQSAVFQPRYIMHSWNPDGIPTEPWLYPDILDAIRWLIRLRYKFLPYIYSSAIRSVLESIPLEVPLWLAYSEDDSLEIDSNNHLVGDYLLVVPPLSVNDNEIDCSFPHGTSWLASDLTTWYCGGKKELLKYPEKEPLYFFRSGSAIPYESNQSGPLEGFSKNLEVLIIPLYEETHSTSYIYEDDGLSEFKDTSYNCYEFIQHKIGEDRAEISITMKNKASNGPMIRTLVLNLPHGFVFYDTLKNIKVNSEWRIELDSVGQTESIIIVKLLNS